MVSRLFLCIFSISSVSETPGPASWAAHLHSLRPLWHLVGGCHLEIVSQSEVPINTTLGKLLKKVTTGSIAL